MTTQQIHNEIENLITTKSELIRLNLQGCKHCEFELDKIITKIDTILTEMKQASNYGKDND